MEIWNVLWTGEDDLMNNLGSDSVIRYFLKRPDWMT